MEQAVTQTSATLDGISDTAGIVREVVLRSGFMHLIDAQVVGATAGAVSLEVDYAPKLAQFDVFFHGGVIAAIADYAGAAAAAVAEPRCTKVLTANLNVTYLDAARRGTLRSNATCIRAGARLRVSRVEVTCDAGEGPKLVAIADVTVSVSQQQ